MIQRYCKNGKPFIYTAFPKASEEQVTPYLQALKDEGASFWYQDFFTPKEERRMQAAFGVLLFVTGDFFKSNRFHAIVDAAVRCGQQILCVYLENIPATPWSSLQLGSQQALSFSGDDAAFLVKLKASSLFQKMKVTPIQKKRQRKNAISAVCVPIVTAAILFFSVIHPLLIAPAAAARNLAKQWGLTMEDLNSVTELYIVGDRVFDSTVHAWYIGDDRTTVSYDLSVHGDMQNQGECPIGTLTSKDLEILSYMPNLEHLCICGNQITDISPILGLTKLIELDLSANPISSIDGLQSLSSLEMIGLTSTDITDASAVWECPELHCVLLDNTFISDISGAEKLKNLEHLTITQSLVSDVSALHTSALLGRIELSLNPVDSLPPVMKNEDLYLDVDSTNIRDFSALASVKSFSMLRLCNVSVSELVPYIKGTPIDRLLWAGLEINSLTELADINILPGGELNLAGCSLTSLDGLEHFKDIVYLDLKYATNLTDLTPILQLSRLQSLTVSSDMRGLAERQLQGATFEILYLDN